MSEPEWFRKASKGNKSSYNNGSSNGGRSYYARSKQGCNSSLNSSSGSTWSQMVQASDFHKRQEEEKKAAEMEALRQKAEESRHRQAEEEYRRHQVEEESRKRQVEAAEQKQQALQAEQKARAQYADIELSREANQTQTQSLHMSNQAQPQTLQETEQAQTRQKKLNLQQTKPAVRKPSVAALDGLRSLAIIGVLLYHLSVT